VGRGERVMAEYEEEIAMVCLTLLGIVAYIMGYEVGGGIAIGAVAQYLVRLKNKK